MADFAFTIPAGTAIDLKLTLAVNGDPFDVAAFLAANGVATLACSLPTGSMTKWGAAPAVAHIDGDDTDVATIHVGAGDFLHNGTWTATLTAGAAVWQGTVAVQAGGIPTVTAGATTVAGLAALTAPEFTLAARPDPSAAWANRDIVVKDVGVDGQKQTCLEQADGSYAWIIAAY